MIELTISDGSSRTHYPAGSEEFTQHASIVTDAFAGANPASWMSVSTAQYNPLYDDEIVSVIFRVKPAYTLQFDREPFVVGRKFFMNNRWIYDKYYQFTSAAECDLPYPLSATPLAIGTMELVYAQAGEQDLSAYQCLYFVCDDHGAVETWCGETLQQGTYSTHYAATFKNGERVRMKTYCYDSADSPYSDWITPWRDHAGAQGHEC